jgi:hypothetical protein
LSCIEDALSALSVIDRGHAIDLLFTDVVMPGDLKSPELARRARERLPGIALLYTSGYTENAIVHRGTLDPGVDLFRNRIPVMPSPVKFGRCCRVKPPNNGDLGRPRNQKDKAFLPRC